MSANVTSFKYSTEESAEILRRHIQEHSMGEDLIPKGFKHSTMESAEILRRHIQKHSISGAHGLDLTAKDFKHSTTKSAEILKRHFQNHSMGVNLRSKNFKHDTIHSAGLLTLYIQAHAFPRGTPPRRDLRKPSCAYCRQTKRVRTTSTSSSHDNSEPQAYVYTEPQVPDPIWDSIEKQIREEKRRHDEAKAEADEPKVPNHIDYSPDELRHIQAVSGVDFNGKRLPAKVQSCIWPSTKEGKAWQQRQYLMREVKEVGGYPVPANQMEIEEYLWVEPYQVLKREEISEEVKETKVWEEGELMDRMEERLGAGRSWEDIDAEMHEAEGF